MDLEDQSKELYYSFSSVFLAHNVKDYGLGFYFKALDYTVIDI